LDRKALQVQLGLLAPLEAPEEPQAQPEHLEPLGLLEFRELLVLEQVEQLVLLGVLVLQELQVLPELLDWVPLEPRELLEPLVQLALFLLMLLLQIHYRLLRDQRHLQMQRFKTDHLLMAIQKKH
jgi:hypothetical protein